MKNGDLPAGPITATEIAYRTIKKEGIEDYVMVYGGLSKREAFAVMAMQGLTAQGEKNPEGAAALSIDMADALLKALEEE